MHVHDDIVPQVHVTVRCLPAWWRLAQCLRSFHDTGHYRNLANAGKYSTLFLGELVVVRGVLTCDCCPSGGVLAPERGLLHPGAPLPLLLPLHPGGHHQLHLQLRLGRQHGLAAAAGRAGQVGCDWSQGRAAHR